MARKPVSPKRRKQVGLNPKQKKFVIEYLVDLNATQAAIRAGYSAKTAGQIGMRLLKNVHIEEAIRKARDKIAAKTEITAERVLAEMARLAFLDIGKAFNADGSLKPLHEMDEDTRRAVAGLEITAMHAEGVQIGTLSKLKLADKGAALERLMRYLGLFNDKLKLQGDAENPLVLLLKQVQGSALKPVK
jgi:phage terminase small subunit